MQAIVSGAEAEGRDLTAEERSNWDQADSDYRSLSERIERVERIEESARAIGGREPTIAERETLENPSASETDMRSAFTQYLRGGMGSLNPEQRAAMASRYESLTPEARALSVGTDNTGGYSVPDEFQTQIESNMQAFGGMRDSRSTILRTSSGADLLIPTEDDTAQTGAILAENTQVTEQDITFAQTSVATYMYTSKLVRVSFQLLQDQSFPVESWLAGKLGDRLGRITNTHFTTGDGSSKPYGVVTGASAGVTGAAGQTTTILYDDIVDLEHSIDPAYRKSAQWMMSDTMLKTLKKLKDGDGRPLWMSGMAVREPDTILNYRYVINQDVAVPAASAKSLLFGDFSKYLIRDVVGVTLLRLTERYADYLQVGFLAFSRHGGRLIDAGTDPIKYYQHPAS